MVKLFILLLSLTVIPSSEFISQKTTRSRFSAQEVKADFTYLYHTLQAAHYNLYAYTDKAVFDAAYKRIQASIHDSLSLLQVHKLFQPFVLLANIGHCRVDPSVFFQEYSTYISQHGKLFPFEISINNNRARITKNNSKDSSIHLGDELVAIDGQPMTVVLAQLYPYMPGDRPYLKRAVMELFTLPGMMWYVFGSKDAYDVQTKTSDGIMHSYKLAAAITATLTNQPSPVPPAMVFTQELRFIDSVAYLRPGPFFNTAGNKEYDNTLFLHFIDSAFREIGERGTKNLILDLRGNPGGDNSFSDPLVAYFATRPFRFCSQYYLKSSNVLKAFWRKDIYQAMNPLSPEIAAMQKAIVSHADGERFRYTIPYYQPRSKASRFNGQVYVLVNRHSQSNTTTTAALIQDYGFGKLVGEETADMPTGYGSMARFTLPVTKLGIDYPKGYFIRPNGSRKRTGVVPDYPAPDDLFTKKDETLLYTLNLIKRRR